MKASAIADVGAVGVLEGLEIVEELILELRMDSWHDGVRRHQVPRCETRKDRAYREA